MRRVKQLELGDFVTNDMIQPFHAIQVKRLERKLRQNEWVETYLLQCRAHRLPMPTRELHFATKTLGRDWRFDFCWQRYQLAAEFEGLVVRRLIDPKTGMRVLTLYGRHATVDGFREDCVKYNSAALLGWTVLRFERDQISNGDAIDMTRRVLMARGWQPEKKR